MSPPKTPPPKPTPPSLHLDWQDWLPLLEDEDIPEADKRAFIEALWDIAMAFVDLGWGLSTDAEICGQSLDLAAVLRAAVVNSTLEPEPEDV